MKYLLENINKKDQEKITNDFEKDEFRKVLLIKARERNEFPKTLAIDREGNNYIFLAPLASHEDSFNRPYFAYFYGRQYRFNSTGSPANTAYFVGAAPESNLQEEIKETFSVYGRWGEGNGTSKKEARLSFVPEFKEGK